MHFALTLIIIALFIIQSNHTISAKGREGHGIDFAHTVLGYKDWENLREWKRTLQAKDPLLYTIQIQDILSRAAAIAIDFSGTEGSESNDFFILESYFQMKQFSKNSIDIPRIDDFPSLGFGIMHRHFCHSGFFVDRSKAEDSLKGRIIEEEKTKKFGLGKNKSLIPEKIRINHILNSKSRWKMGRTVVLVPAVANAFNLNLFSKRGRNLARLIACDVYYTHLIGDYIVGATDPLPTWARTVRRFKTDVGTIGGFNIVNRIKLHAMFKRIPQTGNDKKNAQKALQVMSEVFPHVIMTELRRKKLTTYLKLKENHRVAKNEIDEKRIKDKSKPKEKVQVKKTAE